MSEVASTRGRLRARVAAARANRARRRRAALHRRLHAARQLGARRWLRDDLGGLMARAEREYRSRGLRPGFRLTPLSPPAFERLLRERGYVVDTEAVVMVAEALPRCRRADGARRRDRARARRSTRNGCASSRPSSATGRPSRILVRAGCSARGTSPRRFALARLDGAAVATGYARLEGDWLYIACVGTFPEHRRRGLARASASASSPGAPSPARGEPSCRSRRKTPRRRGFMSSSASARDTSTATSSRVVASLTNTPFWASQGPDGCCRCRSTGGPRGCRGYAEGPLVTCGEPYV